MKKTTIAALCAVSVLFIGTGSAFAFGGMHDGNHRNYTQNNGGRMGQMSQAPAYTAEQQKAFETIMKDGSDAMQPLREQAFAKRVELDALTKSGTASADTISKVAKEYTDIMAQMKKLGTDYHDKLAAAGFEGNFGRGMGMGMNMGHDYDDDNNGRHHNGKHGGNSRGYGNCPQSYANCDGSCVR